MFPAFPTYALQAPVAGWSMAHVSALAKATTYDYEYANAVSIATAPAAAPAIPVLNGDPFFPSAVARSTRFPTAASSMPSFSRVPSTLLYLLFRFCGWWFAPMPAVSVP